MTKPLHLLTNGRTAGFTLVEVLVTIVVMAVGLLGFAALQTVALKSSRTALHHSYATFYAYDIVDCMRVNRAAAIGAAYNFDFHTDPAGGTIAGADMGAWKTALARDLPSGQGKVTVDGQGNTTIEVRWSEGIRSNRTLTFTTQTSL